MSILTTWYSDMPTRSLLQVMCKAEIENHGGKGKERPGLCNLVSRLINI
jgi:hypothetical protein